MIIRVIRRVIINVIQDKIVVIVENRFKSIPLEITIPFVYKLYKRWINVQRTRFDVSNGVDRIVQQHSVYVQWIFQRRNSHRIIKKVQ